MYARQVWTPIFMRIIIIGHRALLNLTTYMYTCTSLAGQPLHKRGRVWCNAYTRVVLLQPGVQPNQITHHVTSSLVGLSQVRGLTNQVPDILVQSFVEAVPSTHSDQPGARSS